MAVSTNEEIGIRIREKRRMLGLTQEDLSARLEAHGVVLSAAAIGHIEHGRRGMSPQQLSAMIAALNATASLLLGYQESGLEELAYLNTRKLKILDYAANHWDGDKQALWEFCLLYMSLPHKDRAWIAQEGIEQYKKAKKSGSVDANAPQPDMAYIISAWEKIARKR